MNDLMMLRGMDAKEGLSPYEQIKLDHLTAKNHTGGVAVAGLVTGVVGVTAGVTAWLFGGLFANAKGKEAKEVAIAAKEQAALLNGSTQRQLDQLTLTAQQQAELAASQATQQVMTQTYSDFVTGRASLNPTPVSLYSSPQPCACPASGCGCGM